MARKSSTTQLGLIAFAIVGALTVVAGGAFWLFAANRNAANGGPVAGGLLPANAVDPIVGKWESVGWNDTPDNIHHLEIAADGTLNYTLLQQTYVSRWSRTDDGRLSVNIVNGSPSNPTLHMSTTQVRGDYLIITKNERQVMKLHRIR